ncbi:methyltransferase, FxLD system [Actinocorallia sp. API 0066]|uniref:methyltransferase, FxLD system n=1 Tax=Actinocorallia sp. API 0066 TaxID=2896846 RepID=UPI001E506D6B|nr:methyltransferase, FxLD system [Actinocorallia sp. API 0066]MCD0451363.1 methyltransferase, FxLD system [Actinocorallia sp. API 0066]
MDWNDENLPASETPQWNQATISFGDQGVEAKTATVLREKLEGQRWHFLRKEGKVRLRTEHPVGEILDDLVTTGLAAHWVSGVYEPETDAFGGPDGMALAHDLFCADSPAALAETGDPRARERTVLLLSTMHRAAGLDPFEIGDVWARLAALRPRIDAPHDPASRAAAIAGMRRLMHADAAQRENAEPGWAERVEAFHTTGRDVARLAASGVLTRGSRAVLTHHAIFALNRAGVPPNEQAALAWLGRHASFDDEPGTAVFTGPATPPAHNLDHMESTITSTTDPAELRDALATTLTSSGHLRTPEIIEAFRTVERHTFIPDAGIEAAYADDAVPIKHDDHGEMISCISAPSIVATQLEQLGARPGHNVLEAGAATGYNAALLGRVVAPGGHVWTVDVDDDLVGHAAARVAASGAGNISVLLADGATGLPEHGPYDRIQFTVSAADIPPAVLEQLAPGGRLVIPMRIRGSISRSFAFERADGQTWKVVSCEMASFVPLRKGICDDVSTLIHHDGEGDVRLETFTEQQVDREAMRTILDQPSHKVYTGVKFRQGSPWQWVYLWLACVLPNGLSRMPGRRPGFTPHFGWGSIAALDGDSLAYLTIREGEDHDGRYWEIGIIGHGPGAAVLADQVSAAISEWDRDYGNDAPEPGFRMATAAHRDLLTATDPRFIIDKPLSRLVIDWR